MFFLNQFVNIEFGYLAEKNVPTAKKVIATQKNNNIQEIM
jgi:hypothetical protein